MMSGDDFSGCNNQCLSEEIEALREILSSELDVTCSKSGGPVRLQTVLYPSTADDANQQYVCLTLVMNFPPNYPEEEPQIELKNPRGLGDDFLANVLNECREKCASFAGCPVIYEITELLRECLTNSNKPTGHCTICLFGFHSEDVFTYTQCYHHFHSHCLLRYCQNLHDTWREEEKQEAQMMNSMKEKKQKKFTCPVCREAISVDLAKLKEAPAPLESLSFSERYESDARFRRWRRQMDAEYEKQKLKGGIIDQLADDNRFLVVTESTLNGVAEPTPPEVGDAQPASVVVDETTPASVASNACRERLPRFGGGRGRVAKNHANNHRGDWQRRAGSGGGGGAAAAGVRNWRRCDNSNSQNAAANNNQRSPTGCEPR